MDVSHSVLTIWIFRSPHEDDGHDKEKEEGNDNDEFSCHPFILNFHTHQHTAIIISQQGRVAKKKQCYTSI